MCKYLTDISLSGTLSASGETVPNSHNCVRHMK